jgi:hypothetical protein
MWGQLGMSRSVEQLFARVLALFEQVLYRRTHVRSNA